MNRYQATPAPVQTPVHGLPNRSPLGSANSQTSNQNALSNNSLRTTQEQLLAHHDLPRSLPPLPSLQTSNLHQYSALQHQYFSMLAANANDSFSDSAVNHTMTANNTLTAAAQAAPSLDALLESASSQYTAQAGGDERSTEPLSFASLFSASADAAPQTQQQQTQTTTTAPNTPLVHDVSAFTTMQNSLFAPTLFDFSSLGFPGAPPLPTIDTSAIGDDSSPQTSPYVHDVGTYTPPSASDPPALSFSPTSPYDQAMLQATPSTGLTLMDVMDFDADGGDMPLFGYEDNLGLTRTLFGEAEQPLFTDAPVGAEEQHVAPSALGLKGVQAAAYQSAPAQQQQQLNLDGLIAMSGTPSVVPIPLSAQLPTSALPSTSTPAASTSSPVSTRKPTGHRKNLSPSALLPVDAPTQPRSYRGPSATSRKDVPAFAIASSSSSTARGTSSTPSAAPSSTAASRKRKAADDFDDLEDDDELDAQGKIKPRMGESEIEAKRRQNTLAARRSRHRKLAYVRELEEKVLGLMRENEGMRERLVRAGLE